MLDISVYYIDEPSEANNLGGRYNIFINENQSKQKIWQDFGHELGHICFHEGDQRVMSSFYRNYQESLAINFAHHFCIPTFMLNQIELPQMQQEAAGIVADIFNVEGEFANQRLTKWLMDQPQREGVAAF